MVYWDLAADMGKEGVQPPSATPDEALKLEEIIAALSNDGAEKIESNVINENEFRVTGFFETETRIYEIAPDGVFYRNEPRKAPPTREPKDSTEQTV